VLLKLKPRALQSRPGQALPQRERSPIERRPGRVLQENSGDAIS